jgi:hypothetical protein
MNAIKKVEFEGKEIHIKTKQKTITIDEDHAWLLKHMGVNASQLLREAIDDYIQDNPGTATVLNVFYATKCS